MDKFLANLYREELEKQAAADFGQFLDEQPINQLESMLGLRKHAVAEVHGDVEAPLPDSLPGHHLDAKMKMLDSFVARSRGDEPPTRVQASEVGHSNFGGPSTLGKQISAHHPADGKPAHDPTEKKAAMVWADRMGKKLASAMTKEALIPAMLVGSGLGAGIGAIGGDEGKRGIGARKGALIGGGIGAGQSLGGALLGLPGAVGGGILGGIGGSELEKHLRERAALAQAAQQAKESQGMGVGDGGGQMMAGQGAGQGITSLGGLGDTGVGEDKTSLAHALLKRAGLMSNALKTGLGGAALGAGIGALGGGEGHRLEGARKGALIGGGIGAGASLGKGLVARAVGPGIAGSAQGLHDAMEAGADIDPEMAKAVLKKGLLGGGAILGGAALGGTLGGLGGAGVERSIRGDGMETTASVKAKIAARALRATEGAPSHIKQAAAALAGRQIAKLAADEVAMGEADPHTVVPESWYRGQLGMHDALSHRPGSGIMHPAIADAVQRKGLKGMGIGALIGGGLGGLGGMLATPHDALLGGLAGAGMGALTGAPLGALVGQVRAQNEALRQRGVKPTWGGIGRGKFTPEAAEKYLKIDE